MTFRNVWKYYGDQAVVKDLNLEVNDGELLVIVGASGCGKTTTLRMLAGLEIPSYGQVLIGDEDVTRMKPGARDVAMVFQSYALYPHMTVYKNLAFGLSARGESRAEQRRRVGEVSRILELEELLARKPSQLSGGQRQRVALGRVMLRQPRLSLLDEPLSNLDAALRVQLRQEIVRLQRQLGVTTVYVTHDQVEAMTMGDRIALLDHGRLLQLDTPQVLYESPATIAVASFIGSPKMRLVSGRLRTDSPPVVETLGTTFPLDPAVTQVLADKGQLQVTVGLRPHDLHWAPDAPARCLIQVQGLVETVEPTGAEAFALCRVGGESLVARLPRNVKPAAGELINVAFDPGDIHLFHVDTGLTVVRHTRPTLPSRASHDGAWNTAL